MKRAALLILSILLVLPTGCAYAINQATQVAEEDLYTLYFAAADLQDVSGGDAVGSETVPLTDLKNLDAAQAAKRLMGLLLAGPQDQTLKSPFPAGTQLLGVEMSGSRAAVDLSAAYGMLSGIALTLADYCITLTLTQLSAITAVSITVRGEELAYRDRQTFTAMDVLLSSTEDVVSTVPATLYFLNKDGKLTGVEQRLDLYEGDTQVAVLVKTLQSGPEQRGLTSALPEGFSILSVWLEDDICYVNLPSTALQVLPRGSALQTAMDALAESLASLDAVGEVRYLVDGDYADFYGGVPIGTAYPRGL